MYHGPLGLIYGGLKTGFTSYVFEFLSGPELASLGSVIVIDIVMSGDNAIIIGMAAAGLPPDLRRRAIVYGIMAATVLRIVFALVTFKLLALRGLALAGGVLLAWVCWHMWREIRYGQMSGGSLDDAQDEHSENSETAAPPKPVKTLRQALITIILADVSMSLDNVLAVAGAAHEFLWVLIFGLMLSIAMMAVAANFLAKLLERHHWIAYVGLLVIVYVAGDMIYRGFMEVAAATT